MASPCTWLAANRGSTKKTMKLPSPKKIFWNLFYILATTALIFGTVWFLLNKIPSEKYEAHGQTLDPSSTIVMVTPIPLTDKQQLTLISAQKVEIDTLASKYAALYDSCKNR